MYSMPHQGISAIQTRYAGCHFRSRLEARWAVFFDALDVPWEYEPEGFETPAGRYLPDFRIRLDSFLPGLPTSQYWFEVKPDGAPDDPRHQEFASGVPELLIVARGMARSYAVQLDRAYLSLLFPWGGSRRIGLTEGKTHDRRKVDAAYTAARSARFGR